MKLNEIETLPVVLSIREISRVLGVGKNTAYGLIRDGHLHGIRVGRQIRVTRVELLRYLGLAG